MALHNFNNQKKHYPNFLVFICNKKAEIDSAVVAKKKLRENLSAGKTKKNIRNKTNLEG
ncbi:MAG: hypothetical protein HYT62_01560 [Candidatus Yanofskybacteria bacterium]|nr:hypothetical protein [Candidatus Yanofskybacteria bacterium]